MAFEEEVHLIVTGKKVIVRIEFCVLFLFLFFSGNSFYRVGKSAKGKEAFNSAH